MTMTLDYASAFELRRARRRGPRYLMVLAVWTGLLLVRPALALRIWRERPQIG
jgi:hypothetical protein